MKHLILSLLVIVFVAGCAKQAPPEQIGSVERLDPRMDRLVGKSAYIEKVAEGFEWSEGPLWVKKGNYLLFSDVPNNVIHKYEPGKGVSEYMKPSGYTGKVPRKGEPGSNGLAFDYKGRLTICQHGDRKVIRIEPDGTRTTMAERYQGRRFNSPNDCIYDRQGNLFFTDPPYGLEGKMNDPAKEIPFQGVYRVSWDGKLTLLTNQLSMPNGIALSPDDKTLYVNVSDPAKAICMAYDVKPDGTIGNGRVFFDVTSLAKSGNLKGLPDGLKVDAKGNVWATGPGGVLVFTPDGTHLGTIHTGEATANCGFGDDGSTLYMTADAYLLKIKTKTKGLGL